MILEKLFVEIVKMSRTQLSLSDEWETPKNLFEYLCNKYAFYPTLDVCATEKNKKCYDWCGKDNDVYPERKDGLECQWWDKNWMNCPHSDTESWVKKACKEFLENNNETMAIIPANSMGTSYAECCIEPHAFYKPIFERPKFKRDGKQKDPARNTYFVVIWRKQ